MRYNDYEQFSVLAGAEGVGVAGEQQQQRIKKCAPHCARTGSHNVAVQLARHNRASVLIQNQDNNSFQFGCLLQRSFADMRPPHKLVAEGCEFWHQAPVISSMHRLIQSDGDQVRAIDGATAAAAAVATAQCQVPPTRRRRHLHDAIFSD